MDKTKEMLKERLESLVLNNPEDINILDNLLNEFETNGFPIKLQESLLHILERNPKFNFGMPGNLVRTIEKHYKESGYEDLIIKSIERVPTEYNLWLLNRLLNTYEEDNKKARGLSLFRRVERETTDSYVKEIVQDFLSDYED